MSWRSECMRFTSFVERLCFSIFVARGRACESLIYRSFCGACVVTVFGIDKGCSEMNGVVSFGIGVVSDESILLLRWIAARQRFILQGFRVCERARRGLGNCMGKARDRVLGR